MDYKLKQHDSRFMVIFMKNIENVLSIKIGRSKQGKIFTYCTSQCNNLPKLLNSSKFANKILIGLVK
jgi:hypothetical protein